MLMGAVSKCTQVSIYHHGVPLKVLNKKTKEVEAPEEILHGGVGVGVGGDDRSGTISTDSSLSYKGSW